MVDRLQLDQMFIFPCEDIDEVRRLQCYLSNINRDREHKYVNRAYGTKMYVIRAR